MTEEKIVEVSENDILLNDDERCFRKKTKSRFKNLTNAVTIIFRHIKDINKSLKELSDTSLENQMGLDECVNSIQSVIEALDSFGMSDRIAFFGQTKKSDKITVVAPEKRIACTEAFIPFKYVDLKKKSETVDEYPKCWDNFEYGRQKFSITCKDSKDGKEKMGESEIEIMACQTCRFSVSTIHNKKVMFECRYSRSPFYKYLIAPEEKRACIYWMSGNSSEDSPIISVPTEIMVVNFHNLTNTPEINNYGI